VNTSDRVLTLREQNRVTLARQMLLKRENVSALEAVERLVALQAQVTSPPYVGLWTRLKEFRREKLTRSCRSDASGPRSCVPHYSL
jgi:hypothetical protein